MTSTLMSVLHVKKINKIWFLFKFHIDVLKHTHTHTKIKYNKKSPILFFDRFQLI